MTVRVRVTVMDEVNLKGSYRHFIFDVHEPGGPWHSRRYSLRIEDEAAKDERPLKVEKLFSSLTLKILPEPL